MRAVPIRGRDRTGDALALLVVAALAVLLLAGGLPTAPAVATFALGVLGAVALAGVYRRASAAFAARRFRTVERDALLAAARAVRELGHSGLALSLEAIGAPAGAPGACAVGQAAREAVAAARRERTATVAAGRTCAPVAVHVAVQEDRRVEVPYLAVALRALIENAVAASPPGGRVDVWVRGACVEVRDQGPGFAAGARTGLGLTVARTVARRGGGDLLVCDRTDGPGARVILTLR